MKKTVGELAALIGGEVHGDEKLVIKGLRAIEDAGPRDLIFVDSPRYFEALLAAEPGAVLLAEVQDRCKVPQIIVDDPRMAFFMIAHQLAERPPQAPGISPEAFVDSSAEISSEATVMPQVYVGPSAKVGAGTVLYPGVYLGAEATVGRDCLLHAGVCLGDRVRLGDRVILHFNVSIGADGFGYLQRDGINIKVPQLGGVVIENDVEIGALSAVDRGTLGDTVIGEGTKIDNLVQVAHNCRIGKQAILVAHTGLGGSTTLGDRVMMGPRSGTKDHITVGNDAKIGGLSAVHQDVADGAAVIGVPAIDHIAWKRNIAYNKKLGETMGRIRELESQVARLSAIVEKDRSES